MTFKLRGLDPTANYIIHDFDVSASTSVTGKELMELGLSVKLPAAPASVLITYAKGHK